MTLPFVLQKIAATSVARPSPIATSTNLAVTLRCSLISNASSVSCVRSNWMRTSSVECAFGNLPAAATTNSELEIFMTLGV